MLPSRLIKRRALRELAAMPALTLRQAHLAQLKGAIALLIHLDPSGTVDNAKVIRHLPEMMTWLPHVVVWLRDPNAIERATATSRLKTTGGVAFKLNLAKLARFAERKGAR